MKLIIFGAGGHAKVVISTALEVGYTIEGIYDDDPKKHGIKVLGMEVRGPILSAKASPETSGIIAIGDNRIRRKLAQKLSDWNWAILIHPTAYIHNTVVIGEGTVIFAGAIVQPETCIKRHAIINTGAVVDHDCYIGDFSHIAPGVKLTGNVKIGEGVFIGVGASVLPGISIGDWSVVGAGAVVIDDVPPGTVVAGVPARPIKQLKGL